MPEGPVEGQAEDTAIEIRVPPASDPIVRTTRRADVVRIERPETTWLSTGANGGCSREPAAYIVSVPEGWDRTDLAAYASERRQDAGFTQPGPTLLTGVDAEHGRVARAGPVAVVATAGLSNPAPLLGEAAGNPERIASESDTTPADHVGTVNVVAVVDRPVLPAARANLLTVVAEAKAATLLDAAGVPGTTTDAVIVGTGPDTRDQGTTEDGGDAPDAVRFTGSGTEIGAAVRACTHDAIRASLRSRYSDESLAGVVESAEYSVRSTVETGVTEA